MKVIELTRGFVAWVDDEDYEELACYKWCVRIQGRRAYAGRNRHETNGVIYMHREIMGNPYGIDIDHIKHRFDEKVVDNRRSNIRQAPGYINNQSVRKRSDAKHSVFKGVRKAKTGKPWQAFITAYGNRRHLGGFWCEGYAALLYDLEAVAAFGEFALTNFPVPGSTNYIFGQEDNAC